jgi:hypothetical protein
MTFDTTDEPDDLTYHSMYTEMLENFSTKMEKMRENGENVSPEQEERIRNMIEKQIDECKSRSIQEDIITYGLSASDLLIKCGEFRDFYNQSTRETRKVDDEDMNTYRAFAEYMNRFLQ